MPTLTIQGRIINFPSSAQSPNWSQSIIDFAEAVADALEGIAGTYDVSPQVYTIVSDINNNVDVPSLTFSTGNVRAAFVRYAYYRTSDTTTEVEAGTIECVYNDGTGAWQISREATGTSTTISFNMTNTGQIQLSTTAIGGTFTAGALTYTAQALLKPV